MLLTAVASPFKSDVDDSVAKAFGFALVAVFFFALVIKVNVLTEDVDAFLGGQQRDDFSFNIAVVSTIAVALALVMTVLMALQQFVHAARAPIIKLRSTSGRPALTVGHGITWHLFLSQYASSSQTCRSRMHSLCACAALAASGVPARTSAPPSSASSHCFSRASQSSWMWMHANLRVEHKLS